MATSNDPGSPGNATAQSIAKLLEMFKNLFNRNAGMDRIDLSLKEGEDFHDRLMKVSEIQKQMAENAFDKEDNPIKAATLEWRSEVLKELAEPFNEENIESLAEKPLELNSQKIADNMLSKLDTKLREHGFDGGMKDLKSLQSNLEAHKMDPKDLLGFDKELINEYFDPSKAHHRSVIQGLNRATQDFGEKIKEVQSPALENGHESVATYENGLTHEQANNTPSPQPGRDQNRPRPGQSGPSAP